MRREAHAKPVRHRNVSTHAHDRSARFQNVVSQIALARAPFHHPDPGHGSCANSCAHQGGRMRSQSIRDFEWKIVPRRREVGVDFDLVPFALKCGSTKGWGLWSRYSSLIRFKEMLNAKFDLLIDDLDRSFVTFLFLFSSSFRTRGVRSHRSFLLCKFNFLSRWNCSLSILYSSMGNEFDECYRFIHSPPYLSLKR